MLADAAVFRFGTPDLIEDPFPHFCATDVLAETMQAALLRWFRTGAPWRLVETDFYEQWEFSLLHAKLPEALSPLVRPDALAELRSVVEQQFGTTLGERMTAVAHRLLPGQRIGIHNDYLPGEETHRITIQINQELTDDDGGLFLLFNSFDPGDVHSILRPISGTAIGFEISERSHHAVSRIHGGERYTLVFSFFGDDPAARRDSA